MKTRPKLNDEMSVQDFEKYYWLKKELQVFCKNNCISTLGSKIDLTNTISEYLKSGKIIKPKKQKTIKKVISSKPINPKTILGSEYRSYEEKKVFFLKIIGPQFHFTAHLLDYFKKNSGKKTYQDFINEYYREKKIRKNPNYKKEIPRQFEYNTYIRDFIEDNKEKTLKAAIKCWKKKKTLPGNNKYSKKDINWLI